MKHSSSSQGKRKGTRHPEWLLFFMLLTILVIAGFQVYWLRDNYNREKQTLEIKTNAAFRQTILRLQASKLKLEGINVQVDSLHVQPPQMAMRTRRRDRNDQPQVTVSVRKEPNTTRKEPTITIVNLLQERIREIELPDSIDYTYGKVILSGLKDSLNKMADSLQKYFRRPMKGVVRQFAFSSPELDSIDPDRIKGMTIHKGTSARGPGLTIRYKDKADSITHVEDLAMEREPVRPTAARPILHTNPKDTARNSVIRFLYDVDSLSLKDSVTVKEVASAYANRLKDEKIDLAFAVNRVNRTAPDSAVINEVTIGFSNPMTYRLSLGNQLGYILGKLKMPILFSLLLVGITIASFVALYRSLLRQHRLAQMKNDLISNITHELKTPIATVGVAIEALKNFNAIQDPQRTREYLDISQNELQRLGLLVDKVLKLSMFENKEIDIKYELFNLKDVVDEVVASLRLQLEKHHAQLTVNTEGDTSLRGDRLHMLSVVFNLLDNALKYSKENPVIQLSLKQINDQLELQVADNGIGIAEQYKGKVFDKFFRVPTGDTHNAKGHGLGLSYVAQVVRRHNGTIKVDSREGLGSTFTIILPKSST
jgi:two-component system phosphate regulon sensor histidine kinase PhoR